MEKHQIVKLKTTDQLKIGDVLGDMCVKNCRDYKIDEFKFVITGILDETRVRIREISKNESYPGSFPVYNFFKLGPPEPNGHKLTKLFRFEERILKNESADIRTDQKIQG